MITPKTPRFVVRYEDSDLYQQALAKAGGDPETAEIDPADYDCSKEATTLASAKRIMRSLERKGHYVQAILERIGIREDDRSWHSDEYLAQHPDEKEWTWDREEEVTA
jgi:hypothetical protein